MNVIIGNTEAPKTPGSFLADGSLLIASLLGEGVARGREGKEGGGPFFFFFRYLFFVNVVLVVVVRFFVVFFLSLSFMFFIFLFCVYFL